MSNLLASAASKMRNEGMSTKEILQALTGQFNGLFQDPKIEKQVQHSIIETATEHNGKPQTEALLRHINTAKEGADKLQTYNEQIGEGYIRQINEVSKKIDVLSEKEKQLDKQYAAIEAIINDILNEPSKKNKSVDLNSKANELKEEKRFFMDALRKYTDEYEKHDKEIIELYKKIAQHTSLPPVTSAREKVTPEPPKPK